jgi:hypothetical protein
MHPTELSSLISELAIRHSSLKDSTKIGLTSHIVPTGFVRVGVTMTFSQNKNYVHKNPPLKQYLHQYKGGFPDIPKAGKSLSAARSVFM